MSGDNMKMYAEDIQTIVRMERYFGPLHKTLPPGFALNQADTVRAQVVELLHKYKTELNIKHPMPNVHTWLEEDRVNFLFFDKYSGKRILLGEWLEGKEQPYEQ